MHHCSFSYWVYSAKLRWSFCCQNLCSNFFQASQGWKNWALQFKKKKEKETALNYSIQSTLHPPSNFYMGSLCFPVCPSPWLQVIGRVSFHFFLCFPFLFLLFLCCLESVTPSSPARRQWWGSGVTLAQKDIFRGGKEKATLNPQVAYFSYESWNYPKTTKKKRKREKKYPPEGSAVLKYKST